MDFIISYSTIVTIGCTILTSLIAFLSYRNNSKLRNNQDITERVKRDTEISTKLDMMITSTSEVKAEMKNLNKKLDEMSERIAKCEESTKQAHDRIDKIEIRLN
jgi:peptidoglycan hydrolase CwlO-like protein